MINLKLYLVTKRSSLTGKENTFWIWFTDEQWQAVQPFLKPGLAEERPIADILPGHTPYEIAFLLSGSTLAERKDYAG